MTAIEKLEMRLWFPMQVTDREVVLGAEGDKAKSMAPSLSACKSIVIDAKWDAFVGGWLFGRLRQEELDGLIAKPGINRIAAVRHTKAVLCSFDLTYEHKTAAAAFLLNEWFV